MLENNTNLQKPRVFALFLALPPLGNKWTEICSKVISRMVKNGPLGSIFTLLGASGQFVGDVRRGQDGPEIVPKWFRGRLVGRKRASSISSRILRVLAPRRRPKRPQDRSQEASRRHRSAVKLSKISSLARSI